MKGVGKKPGSLVLCAIVALAFESATAAPPSSRGANAVMRSPGVADSSKSTGSGWSVAARRGSGSLDLRPPADLSPGPAGATGASAHRMFGTASLQDQLPALGTNPSSAKSMSRAEEFARRVHREGLPVARLWESRSALVSLGLNSRGKPGLWLIQKVK